MFPYKILDLRTLLKQERKELKLTIKEVIKEVKEYVKTTPLDVLIKRWGRNVKKQYIGYIIQYVSNSEQNFIRNVWLSISKDDPETDLMVVKEIWTKLPKHLQRKLILVYLIQKETK